MRISCCIPKATNTHSKYVLIFAFPLQHLLHERASNLRYTTLPILQIINLCEYMNCGSRVSSLTIVTDQATDWTVSFRFAADGIIVVTNSCRPTRRPTHPRIQWEPGTFLEVRQLGLKADHSLATRNQG